MYELTAFLTLLFAMLSIVALVIAVVVVVSLVSGDPAGVVARIRPIALELAAAIGLTAMFGSLYLSEVANYEPCRLCWIQRAFMYPAALLLAAAVATKRVMLAKLGGLLALIGLPVAIFHRFEQANIVEGGVCTTGTPCSTRYVNEFGFITIPTMAGFGFVAMVVLVAAYLLAGRDSTPPVEVEEAPMPVDSHS